MWLAKSPSVTRSSRLRPVTAIVSVRWPQSSDLDPVLIRASNDGLAVLVCDVVGEVPERYPLVKTAPGHRDCVCPLAPKVGLACPEGIQGRLLVDQLPAASAAAAACAKLAGRGRKPRPGAPVVADITR